MALQHFFSRVPARMSMFRKCDSFDTFAKSKELTKEYINGNLTKICEYKPTEEELDFILQDKLPPVYCACFGRDGEDLIQSKFSFVSSDYTGERPSWLCHSLILNKNESNLLYGRPDSVMLNREAFRLSLGDFNLTDKTARYINDCPTPEYPAAEIGSLTAWAEGYDELVMKKIIFAVMNAAASNQKNVYISLAKPLDTLSEEALDFINRLMLIFPGAVRRKISFITEYNDSIQTKNYKIRFIPGHLTDLCGNRGYVVDTGRKISYGVYEDDLTAVKDELDFLYSLFSDGKTRISFLAFYDEAASSRRESLSFSLKIFLDLIYLFRRICGKYGENEIVPDDNAVLRMITTYEKYRTYLKTEDRRSILSVLDRYSESRLAIPQTIFTRIGKIYVSEPEQCKKVIMTVVLDLLHTNIMRDKLFAFIDSTYESESAASRDIICEDLSRVFYGGFLQSDILDFYGKHFGNESEAVKEIILEKLLMTIRTETIQRKILDFIDKYQASVPPHLKQMIYHTFYEMLPENDMLSKRIIPVMGRCMAADDEETKQRVFESLLSLIYADEEKGGGALLEICLSGVRNNLPLGNMLVKRAFGEWNGDARFETVLNSFLGGSLISVGNALKLLWDLVPVIPDGAYKRLYEKASALIVSVSQKNDLFDFLDFDKKVRDALRESGSQNGGRFYGELYSSVIIPLVGTKLSDAFNTNRNKIGLQAILDLAQSEEKLKELPGTEVIKAVIMVVDLVNKGRHEAALGTLMNIPLYMESGKLVSETLKTEFTGIEDASNNTGDIYRDAVMGAMYSYLENGKILLGGIFGKCLERKRAFDLYNKPVKTKSSAKDIQDEDSRTAMTVFAGIVRLCVAVGVMDCAKEVKDQLFANPDSELDKLAKRILAGATKKSKDLYFEIYNYARHGSLRIARKLESAVMNTDDCPRAFKKLF
ncbi:MAG: hypothetical protein PHW77_00085 [Eubacteriales bacterium]|nr:hypothetical protein [Eubacteriales bacterium]